MADIYGLIRKDHDHHRKLLRQISETQDDFEERKKLWDEFYYDVKAHAAAEEESFYSKLLADPDGQDDARHSVAEHKELDDIMEELNGMPQSSPGWLNRFSTLMHEYEHHIEEEEEEIFPKCRSIFSDRDAKKFATKFSERKAEEVKLVDAKAEASLEE